MYNRYIPTENGGYRRQIVDDRPHPVPPPKPAPEPVSPPPPPPKPASRPEPRHHTPPPRKPAPPKQQSSNDTLIRLLSGIDKGDLILLLILVLLLMDGETDNGTLLLTVALYFLLQ